MDEKLMALNGLLEEVAGLIGTTGAEIRRALENGAKAFDSALGIKNNREQKNAIARLCTPAITPYFLPMAKEGNTFSSILNQAAKIRFSFYEHHPDASGEKCCIVDANEHYGVMVYKQKFNRLGVKGLEPMEKLMVLKHFSTIRTKTNGVGVPSILETKRMARAMR